MEPGGALGGYIFTRPQHVFTQDASPNVRTKANSMRPIQRIFACSFAYLIYVFLVICMFLDNEFNSQAVRNPRNHMSELTNTICVWQCSEGAIHDHSNLVGF